MKITKSFHIALNIILHSKLRSWLTVIGIVIGIASIVAIVSVGQGAQQTISSNLNSLSANILTVSPGFSRAAGAGAGFRTGGGEGFSGGGASSSANAPKNLTVSDVTALRGISNIAYIMGTVSGSIEVSYLNTNSKASVQGVDPAIWKYFTTTPLSSGRYLSQGDEGIVVLGSRVANSTFSNIEINRQIEISNKTFRVVGILNQSGGSDDSRIFMPIADAVLVLDEKSSKNFDSISIEIKDISLTTDTTTQVTNLLMVSHGIFQTSKQDFTVTSPVEMQARITSTLSSVSLFLTAIAAISLIVGAIGIMNSMFTSVLEKTRDIGILKAIGAKNSDILSIFLINAAIIGLIGGLFGVLIGFLGSSVISNLASGASIGRISFASSFVSWTLIIEVLAISIGVGLVSGAIPAYRASKLRPIDALRYE